MFLFVPETFWDRLPRPSKHRDASRLQNRPQQSRSNTLKEDENMTIHHDQPESHSLKSAQKASQNHPSDRKVDGNLEVGDKEFMTLQQVTEDESEKKNERLKDQETQGKDRDLTKGSSSSSQSSPAGSATPTMDEGFPNPQELRHYTGRLRVLPPITYAQTLRPWNGRLRNESWLSAAIRPFLLFAYPAILWSTLVYSLSIGWLIVLSEAVSEIYKSEDSYHFTSLQAGLVYISPFVGGILGTVVAGKVSDIIVRFMARRNEGVYEPEFRLVMGIPIAISTCIGLMGFGWSAEERDNWIVPTVFFGVISFGCSLGSTTAITFAVDSYRQYAGEALVTLNFSKSESADISSCYALADLHIRYLPWPGLFSVLQQMACV